MTLRTLRTLRTAAHLTQRDCATRLGASQPTWSRLEAREERGGVAALGVWVWAQALGCIRREAHERRSFVQLQFDIRRQA